MLAKMKIMVFLILISHSLGVDDFPRLTQPQHSLRKGCPNELDIINSSPGHKYYRSDEEEGVASHDSESTMYRRNFNVAETTEEPPRIDSPRGSDNSIDAINPLLPTSKIEYQGGCDGVTDRLPKLSIPFGQVSSDSFCGVAGTKDFFPESEGCNVEGDSEADPNMPSAKSSYSVSTKYPDGRVKSDAPSSDDGGSSPSMCPVAVGEYCQPRSSCQSINYWVTVSNEGCNHECAVSGPIIDESLRNFVTAVHSLQSMLPVFDDHFGNLQKLRSSLTLERSQSSLGLLLNISEDLRAMTTLKDTVAPEKFNGNVRWIKLLGAITDLTEKFEDYLFEIHSVEGSHTRVISINHILRHLRRELIDLLEWTQPVVNYFQDLSRMDD